MKLGYKATLNDNIRKIIVYIKEWGSSDLTPEEEINFIKDYAPKFEYKSLTFTGKYALDSNGNVVKNDSTGEEVSLSIINKIINIKEDLNSIEESKCYFEINTKHVKDSDIEGKSILNTKDKYAEAMCQLFADKITDKIKSLVTDIKDKENDFENDDRESEEF